MKKCLRFLLCAMLFCITLNVSAQTLEDPGTYMTAVSNCHVEMNQKYMQYISKTAHGASARKQEKIRQQVLESITNSRYKVIDLPYYKKDNELRQASIDYIQLCYNVFNEDYNKIVNLEEIAEQSFDEMQAVILLHEKTDEKLNEASKKMEAAYNVFAAKYNVKMVDGSSELSKKIEVAGQVNRYLNNIYLIFFKCNWQDNQMTKALDSKKINDIEQARNSLIKYAEEGLQTLDTIKPFKGDNSILNTCKVVLRAYKNIGVNEVPKLTDFLLKEENFAKLKKSIESKGAPAKEEIDMYNKAVKEINLAVNSSNQAVNNTNNQRRQLLENWNNGYKQFSDNQMPFYK